MVVFKIPIYQFDTENWTVLVHETTNFRFLTPLNGKHRNTLIWLHDYNEDTQLAQSFFMQDKFLAQSTKIVIPESPNREMNYEILG